jgi:hypothetical protein
MATIGDSSEFRRRVQALNIPRGMLVSAHPFPRTERFQGTPEPLENTGRVNHGRGASEYRRALSASFLVQSVNSCHVVATKLGTG